MKKTPNRIVIINSLSAGLLSGISMVMMPLYSYLLGTEAYGLASVYTTWVTILGVVIGLQAASSLGVAQKDFPPQEQMAFQANGIYLGFAMCVVMTGLSILFIHPLSALLEIPLWAVLLLCPHAFGIFCVGMLSSKFTYEFKQEKHLLVSVSMSLGTALISVAAILLLPTEKRFMGKVIGAAVPYILCGACLMVLILLKTGLCIRRKYIEYMLRYSTPLVFSSLCLQLFTGSDKLMLQKIKDNSVVGIYSFALSFSAVISVISYALNHAWSPFYYQYEAANDNQALLKHTKRYTRLFSVLTAGFLLLSPEVFPLFAAPAFRIGLKMIPIFVIGFYLDFLGCFARNYQYYYKQTKIIASISMAVSIGNVFLNAALIPKWGALGAALATMTVQLLSCISHWMVAVFHPDAERKYPYQLRVFIPYLLLVSSAAILFYFPGTGWIRWSLGIVLGAWMLKTLMREKQIF